MAEARWQVYWVTFVRVGGYAVRIACWRFWSLSVSVWFPHMHCDRMWFVIIDPLLFTSLHLFGRDLNMWFSEVCPASRAAIMRGMSGGSGGVCASGCVGVWDRDV